MKERIQEALRRRHRRGDEGFTLIELLVVILIVAILAAVGIVALLGALRSGRKSAAKTTLSNAVITAKGLQTGNGTDDLSVVTKVNLGAAEPDLTFLDAKPADDAPNTVGVINGTANSVTLVTRDKDNNCFFAQLNTTSATMYAATALCADPVAGAWNKVQKDGWKI